MQDVEILVKPVPRIVSNWLIGIGKIISTLIRLKVRAPVACPVQAAHDKATKQMHLVVGKPSQQQAAA